MVFIILAKATPLIPSPPALWTSSVLLCLDDRVFCCSQDTRRVTFAVGFIIHNELSRVFQVVVFGHSQEDSVL